MLILAPLFSGILCQRLEVSEIINILNRSSSFYFNIFTWLANNSRILVHRTSTQSVFHLAAWPGLKKPTKTGPETAVTGQTGPDRFRFGSVSNRPKFKIQIWIQKNEKFSKKILKILQVATNLMVSKIFKYSFI